MTDSPGVLFQRLLDVMKQLREPGGCPWDREQTPTSLKPFLIEEAYEVLEAIESGRSAAVREELGDLLFQVVFHARLADFDGALSHRLFLDDDAAFSLDGAGDAGAHGERRVRRIDNRVDFPVGDVTALDCDR